MNEMLTPTSENSRCAHREADLLLLVHGELSPLNQLRARWHLRTCPECRRQMVLLTAASHGFADVLRSPQMPRWGPPGGRPIPASPAPRLLTLQSSPILFSLFAIILVLVGTTVYVRHSAAAQEPPLPELASPGTGLALCAQDAALAHKDTFTMQPVKSNRSKTRKPHRAMLPVHAGDQASPVPALDH